MIKLKDLLFEHPEDFIDDNVDEIELLYRKKKYYNEATDHEGKMAKAQLERSMKYAKMIYKIIQNVDKGGDGGVQFPAWVQSKLTKSMDYLQSVYNYLDGKDGLEDKFQK
jgi:hypothetical protein|tara:strand:- start:37 stop:366 length:330 start_codon:yes stop_codon:yes gene_type:complete